MRIARLAGLAATLSLLAACNTVDRLEQIGATPPANRNAPCALMPCTRPSIEASMPGRSLRSNTRTKTAPVPKSRCE